MDKSTYYVYRQSTATYQGYDSGGGSFADSQEEASRVAADWAHKYNTDVYIFRVVSRVSPKRDVETTDLTK